MQAANGGGNMNGIVRLTGRETEVRLEVHCAAAAVMRAVELELLGEVAST
ncbi:MAG: hypothetical protein ACT4P3_18515 [Betaproteobacteria bacterium]